MATGPDLFLEERRQEIMRRLEASGRVSVSELGQQLGVSEVTIRADLRALAEQGLVVRTHGGAVLAGVLTPDVARPQRRVAARQPRLKVEASTPEREVVVARAIEPQLSGVTARRGFKHILIDMDGVLLRGRTVIPGADTFIDTLNSREIAYLVLTNNPLYTPGDLAHRLRNIGLNVPKERVYTSALTAAHFLNAQKPGGKAFVVGESGLTEAIHNVGYIISDYQPDYVVLGETHGYNISQISKAIRLIREGAKFIATNPDAFGPTDEGLAPACGAMAALIEKASGSSPFFVGKPNPLMMRMALNYLRVHSEDTIMIGDRMDTDIVAGISSGMETILVLSGVTQRGELERYPYQPTRVLDSIVDFQLTLE